MIVLRHEKLLARFYLLLDECQLTELLPVQLKRHCENAKTLAAKQRTVVIGEVSRLKVTFAREKYPLLFLKGAAYIICNSRAGLGRVFSDIDVLVPKHVIDNAEGRLAINGWLSKEIDDYDEKYYRQWSHEIPPMQHGIRGTLLDLHHNLVPPVSGKAIEMERLLEIAGTDVDGVMILNEAGMFYHSAIHLFFNDDYSAAMRDMTDLYLMVKQQPDSFYQSLFELHALSGFEKESCIALRFLQIDYNVELPNWVSERVTCVLKSIGKWELSALRYASGPKHSLLAHGEYKVPTCFAEIRGHFLKMPPHILVFHSSMKLFRAVTKLLFGEHIFTKATPPN